MLYIYKASAGSGKTHLLVGFFLQSLFNKTVQYDEEKRPLLFNEILAVTFTNKATSEMKERLIEELYTLYTQPEKSDFIDDITQPDTQGKSLSISDVKRRSYAILSAMLNDYSELHVSTIDSFFQQVLRSFAHELNLQGKFEIEIDTDTILDHVVSQFVTSLNAKEDPKTFNWMMEFAAQRLDEGSSWNVHNELLKLAKILTSEDYKKLSSHIAQVASDTEGLRSYNERLRKIQREWKESLKNAGKEGMQILREAGTEPEEFIGKSKSAMNCFNNWAQGKTAEPSDTLISWSNNTALWYGKGCDAKGKLSATQENRLLELMQQAIELLQGEPRTQYESAKSIAKNIFQLGLISRLEQEAKKYCEEKGIQLLSDTTQLLSRLINEEETPFIYEKTGTRIQSFMIDEFQDTSTLQWNNFKPLLSESLDNGNNDLIVGDVKQSIYRWRGSDWELLNSTIYDFRKEQQEFDENHNQLLYNFRSEQNIIDFNNKFFQYAANQLANFTHEESMQKIAHIYQDVEQHVHKSRKEMITPGLLHFEEVKPLDEEESKEEAIQRRLPEVVIALQQKGFKPEQILILGRFNLECKLFAETLLNYKKLHPECPYIFDIITEEALSLANRNEIRAIIAMMHAIYEPKSEYKRMIAECCYLQACGIPMKDAIALHFMSNRPTDLPALPDIQQLSNLPLFEMVEGLVTTLPAEHRQESIFLQAFRDAVLEYTAHYGTDLGNFLKWWDEKGSKQSVSTPKDQSAIRIMTIHQSKGLGEDAVIIPKADWTIDLATNHSEIRWLDPKEMGYKPDGCNESIKLPIRLEASLTKTIFKEDYAEERMRAIIDNLNIAYVAFTRAKKAMVIMTPALKEKDKKSKKETEKKQAPSLSELLRNYFTEDKHNDTLEMKEMPLEEAKNTSSPLSPTDSQPSTFNCQPSTTNSARPQIKRTAFRDTEGETTRGTAIHNALSVVKYADDYELPIRQYYNSGRLELQDISIDELITNIGELLKQPEAAVWFDRKNRVLNEHNIVTYTTHTQRPDRIVFVPDGRVIVIDYKTGKTHSSEYRKQVCHYMKLLRDMGYRNVEGYLWYVDQHEVEQVHPSNKAEQLTIDFS